MPLTLASLIEMKQLMLIVLYISLPILVISMLTATILHYRRKRRKSDIDMLGEESLVLPQTSDSNSAAATAFATQKDGYGLLNYGRQLEDSKQKYNKLEKEFDALKTKYQLLLAGHAGDVKDKAENMVKDMQQQLKNYEAKVAQLQQSVDFLQSDGGPNDHDNLLKQLEEKNAEVKRLQEMVEQVNRKLALQEQVNDSRSNEISKLEHSLKELQSAAQFASQDLRNRELSYHQQQDDLGKQHSDERDKYKDQWKELNEAYKKLQEENVSLQEQLVNNHVASLPRQNSQPLDETEAGRQLQDLVQERDNLKSAVAKHAHLEDLLEEKNLQINFLQGQLDNRISTYHQQEHQHKDTVQQFQQQLAQLESGIEYKQQEVEAQQQTIQSNIEHIRRLETGLKELKQEHDKLHASYGESQLLVASLEEELLKEQEHSSQLRQQLHQYNQLVKKVSEELSSSLPSHPSAKNDTKDKKEEEYAEALA